MGWSKTDESGRLMWEDTEGRRRKEPERVPDKYGWHRIEVDGKIMWESPEGEREY